MGPLRHELEITDGATALCYLSTIAKSPSIENFPDFAMFSSNYLLPLLALLSKLIFWTFARNHDDQEFSVSGVPVMVCVMYRSSKVLSIEDSTPPYFFGSTIPASPHFLQAEDPIAAAQFRTGRGMTTTWRRDRLLKPALARLQTQLPRVDAELHKALVKRLDALVRGYERGEKDAWAQPLHPDLNEYSRYVRQQILARTPGKPLFVTLTKLRLHRYTGSTCTQLLSRMITNVYSIDFNRQDSIVVDDFKKLIRYYIAPHIFLVATDKAEVQKEVTLQDEECSDIDRLVQNLWHLHGESALDKLEHLKETQEQHEDPQVKDAKISGNCAETYPVVAIQ